MVRRHASLLVAAAALLAARQGAAQACCTATGSSELGVVGRCHLAVLTAQLGYDRGLGSIDASGDYAPLEDTSVDDVTLTLAGGARLGTPALQVHGALPLRLQRRDLPGLGAATRLGPGDAYLGLRALLIEDLVAGIDLTDARTWVPFVEPFVGVRAPTGRAPADSRTPSQADVTGEGAWAAVGGVQVTKFVTLRQAVALTGSYARRFPHEVQGSAGQKRRHEPGDEVDLKLGYVNVPGLFWSFTLFTSVRATRPAKTDGVEIPDSDTRRLRVGFGVSHYLSYPGWQLTASLAADPPVDGVGKNVPFAGASVAFGLRRNFTLGRDVP